MGWIVIEDGNGNSIGIVGDSGWDLCSTFVEEFHNLYLTEFGRKANKEELMNSIEFVFDVITNTKD
jgi:hypothetical protein